MKHLFLGPPANRIVARGQKRISSWTVFYLVKKHLCYFKHFCGINFVSISKKAGLVCIYLDSVYFTSLDRQQIVL